MYWSREFLSKTGNNFTLMLDFVKILSFLVIKMSAMSYLVSFVICIM